MSVTFALPVNPFGVLNAAGCLGPNRCQDPTVPGPMQPTGRNRHGNHRDKHFGNSRHKSEDAKVTMTAANFVNLDISVPRFAAIAA